MPLCLSRPAVRLRLFALFFAFCFSGALHAQSIPTDAQPLCPLTSSTFDTWFRSGQPTLNGAVKPADSIAFQPNTDCDFYTWSRQMFLWLTSPATGAYGNGGLVMDSPVFYDVSPPDAKGNRTLVPHTPNFIHNLTLRAEKTGPGQLPIVVAKSGQVFEVKPAAPGQVPLVRNAAGMKVAVASAARVSGQLVLKDAKGNTLTPGTKKALAATAPHSAQLTRFEVKGVAVFTDNDGNPVDVEEGQAGTGGVLMSQGGSLVYSTIMVNDVYAYFLTGAKRGGIRPTPTHFPITQGELDQVVNYAARRGVHFPDPNALTIELKTSWVEASTLPNPSTYVLTTAVIPTYKNVNGVLVATGKTKTAQLAMVGMHVVGSVTNHAEMVWSTFEHFGNTPNAAYQYLNTSGQMKTIPQITVGNWLFSSANSQGPYNQELARLCTKKDKPGLCRPGVDIVPNITGTPIGPSDTLRVTAWGSAFGTAPNGNVTTAAQANTEVISMQNALAALMPAGDLRSNYFMTGSTWSQNGYMPTTSYGCPDNTTCPAPAHGMGVGTSLINNSTMETYVQLQTLPPVFQPQGGNCLLCHQSFTNRKPDDPATTAVSHIYQILQPLPIFPLPPTKKK